MDERVSGRHARGGAARRARPLPGISMRQAFGVYKGAPIEGFPALYVNTDPEEPTVRPAAKWSLPCARAACEPRWWCVTVRSDSHAQYIDYAGLRKPLPPARTAPPEGAGGEKDAPSTEADATAAAPPLPGDASYIFHEASPAETLTGTWTMAERAGIWSHHGWCGVEGSRFG